MIDTTQPQPKNPSNPAKSLTIICSVLAVILLLASTTMYLSARSKAQEIEDTWDAAQSTDTKAMELDSEIKSIESQINEAKAKKDAQKWCDDVTRENAVLDKLRTQGNTLKSMAQNKRDAINSLCPQKKAFAEAFAKDAKQGMIGPENIQCVVDGSTMTFNATIKIDAPRSWHLATWMSPSRFLRPITRSPIPTHRSARQSCLCPRAEQGPCP